MHSGIQPSFPPAKSFQPKIGAFIGPNAVQNQPKKEPFVDVTNQKTDPIVIDDSLETTGSDSNSEISAGAGTSGAISHIDSDHLMAHRESQKEGVSQAELWAKIKESHSVNQTGNETFDVDQPSSSKVEAFETAKETLNPQESAESDSDSDIEIVSHANKVTFFNISNKKIRQTIFRKSFIAVFERARQVGHENSGPHYQEFEPQI